MRRTLVRRGGLTLVAASVAATALITQNIGGASSQQLPPDRSIRTTTPIKHLVVLFDENVSFDHYFATYPKAANTGGTPFHAPARTPKVDTLAAAHLLKHNPNLYDPKRLSAKEALTCDQNHNYGPEQKAADGGAADAYVQNVSVDTCTGLFGAPGLTMDYYDGNTVTALWNYASHYAMSDRSFGSTFGPSTPGALNLVSGQTHGARAVDPTTLQTVSDSYAVVSPDAQGVGTVINDPDPAYDDCSNKNRTSSNNLAAMDGRNIGDLLNQRGVTWGWFQGGFRPTTAYQGKGTYAVCGATHSNIGGAASADYSPHHSPFEYYKSTANPHHLPPTSVRAIGHTDQANHNYDLSDFDRALGAGNLPAVSFLKAAEYQDGHAGYSDPIDEQNFLIKQINAIQRSKFWSSTAIVVAYDDSDGWYDHVVSPVKNASNDPAQDSELCTSAIVDSGIERGYQDRCGPGPRLPLLVISPWSKANYVGHTPVEQASITKLIEQNWQTGRIGDASFDKRAGSLKNLFSFSHPNGTQLLLKPDGAVQSVRHTCGTYGRPC